VVFCTHRGGKRSIIVKRGDGGSRKRGKRGIEGDKTTGSQGGIRERQPAPAQALSREKRKKQAAPLKNIGNELRNGG